MIVIGCSGAAHIAQKLARNLKADYLPVEIDFFPDSELRSQVKLKTSVRNKQVLVVQTFFPKTNDKIIEALFVQDTLKKHGAREISLVAPYFPYLREDKEFHPGESVAAQIMPHLFSSHRFEHIFITDPHLHRLTTFEEFFPNAVRFTTTPLLASYIKSHIKRPVIVGPDGESFQWNLTIAEKVGCKATILHKQRYSSQHVEVQATEPIEELIPGNDVIFVDDIIGTGHTMYEAIKIVKRYNPRSIHCFGVHGLFLDTPTKNKIAKEATIYTTDTVSSDYTKISIVPDLSWFIIDFYKNKRKAFITEKRTVAHYAFEKLRHKMTPKTIIGIGSGTTMEEFVKCLGTSGKEVQVISSSEYITQKIKKYPTLTVLSNTKKNREQMTFAIDGADQVDFKKQILKGQGALAYEKEKELDYAAKQVYILIDNYKLQPTLTQPILVRTRPNEKHKLSQFLLTHPVAVTKQTNDTYYLHADSVDSYKTLERELDAYGLANGIFTQFKKKPRLFVGYQHTVREL